MKNLIFAIAVFFSIFTSPLVFSQVLSQSKIYVASADNGLDQLVTAEILRQKLSFTVVSDPTQANYILKIGYGERDRSNRELIDFVSLSQGKPVVTARDAAITLTSVSDQTIVWAEKFSDYEIELASYNFDGLGALAKKIVKKLKKAQT